jgi:hypothetical protein
MSTPQAPRAFNRHLHSNRDQVFYGTDDGAQDGSFSEFPDFVSHYNSVGPERQSNIHMISVVGGLYGLNMIPLWKPKRITIFDINPMGVSYFKVVRHLFTSSDSTEDMLAKMSSGDYEVEDEDQQFIKENIMMKQAGTLPRSRGSSKRSFEESWKNAFDHFDLTKELLSSKDLEIRTTPMESGDFAEMIRNDKNCWIYGSNITQFHWFDLEVNDPANMVCLQIIHPDQPQLLDLSEHAGHKVKVKFQIPLSVERID